MNIFKTYFLLAAGSLLLPANLLAQPPLSWKDCVKEAAAHNLDLLIAEQSVKSSDDLRSATLGQFLPQISVGASLSRSGSDPALAAPFTDPNYSSRASLNLSAQQEIFNGFKNFASTDQASAQWDLDKARLDQTKAQVSRDLKSSFYQLLYSQKQINLLAAIAERQKSNTQLVEMNYKGGTDNKGSLLQARAAYKQAQYEVSQAQRALKVAQRQLAQLLGREQDSIEVSGDFEVQAPPDSPNYKEITLHTPAHFQSEAHLRSSESQWLSARGFFFPTVSANASLFRDGADFESSTPGWSAGLEFSLPIFTGGRNLYTFRSAEEAKRGAQESLVNSDLRTESALESAYAGYQNAVENTKVQEAFLLAAKTREEIAKAQYLNGLLSFQNWDLIETNLTIQEKSELSSYLGAKTAEANWELAQGKGVIP